MAENQSHPDLARAVAALNREQFAEANQLFKSVLDADPNNVEAYVNRGYVLNRLGETDAAIASYQKSVEVRPNDAKLYAILGAVLQSAGRAAEAEASYRRAVALKPGDFKTFLKLGRLLLTEGRPAEAEGFFRHALTLNPASADVHFGLASLCQNQGRVAEAEAHFRQVIQLAPDHVVAHSSLIFTIDLRAPNAAAMQPERKRWADQFAASKRDKTPFANTPDPDRRLKVGYVSADFRQHSAAMVFGAMLTKYNRDQFEVYAYDNSSVADDLTRRFQQTVPHWRHICGLSDDAVARMIRDDGIDILVDLSGHSSGNRLLVFARKPAPIQITAWGFLSGTGLEAMDAILADPVIVPENERAFYSEEVVYLPNGVNGAYFLTKYPDVNELPAATAGNVTFGSFNRLVKLSDEVIKLWARVLLAVPGSRMIIKSPGLESPQLRLRIIELFSNAGVETARIVFMGRSSWSEHMAAFNQIDIALDTFPHCGGVTTLEGLMMGIPVVTLRWPTIVGRVSASCMTTLELVSWIANTQDEYVAIAAEKAKDLARLSELRETLRARVLGSVLGDGVAYAMAVEREYRKLWKKWCDAR